MEQLSQPILPFIFTSTVNNEESSFPNLIVKDLLK